MKYAHDYHKWINNSPTNMVSTDVRQLGCQQLFFLDYISKNGCWYEGCPNAKYNTVKAPKTLDSLVNRGILKKVTAYVLNKGN